jgi:hypothetical protein
MTLAGRYLYVGRYGDGTLDIIDIGGLDMPAAKIGALETSEANVWDNLDVGNNLFVRAGLNVGSGGIFSNGPLAVSLASTTQSNPVSAYFQGFVGIGLIAPSLMLEVSSTTSAGPVARFTNATGNCTINPTTTSLSCSSDQRLKKNIAGIDASSTLAGVLALQPVSYNWNGEATGTPPHTGFIAQAVQPIFPDLVSQGPDGFYTLNYAGFTPYLTEAIQQIATLSDTFKNTLIAWLGSAANGIGKMFAAEVDTQKLCVGSTCIDQQQLAVVLADAGQTDAPQSRQGSDASSGQATSSPDTPPIIQINGDNPATINVGAVYNDLGATITGPAEDLNLDIVVSVDGGATTTPDQISVDTSTAGTHSIEYIATDQAGEAGTATRTLNVVAPAPPTDATTSTP